MTSFKLGSFVLFIAITGLPSCGGEEMVAEDDGQVAPIRAAHTQSPFTLSVASTDATSVKLRWSPLADAVEYVVSRNGVVVGSTVGRTGYFTDFGLQVQHPYRYRVTALDASGATIAQSNATRGTTTSCTALRTSYTVLAIAFTPNGESVTTEATYLEHRIQFLRLASAGSARIRLYGGGIVTSPVTPATEAGSNGADYAQLVTARDLPGLHGHSMVDLVERGDIDHVWVVKSPDEVSFAENVLVGNRLIQGNGLVTEQTWTPLPVKSSRSFFVNSYLPDERSWDAYTHMAEGVMTSVTQGHPETFPRAWEYTVYTSDRTSLATTTASLNLFERFRLGDEWTGTAAYASPGNGNCGTSHFPPNTPRSREDYAYYDVDTWRRYIDSPADAWLSFPRLPDTRRKLNGYDYGAFHNYVVGDLAYGPELAASSPQDHRSFAFGAASYHQWWFGHLPHNPGTEQGMLNDWWGYLFDFNRFDGTPIDYPVTGAPEIPTTFRPRNGEYGTEERDAGNWAYWNSQNGFSPGGKAGRIEVVDAFRSPSSVTKGRHAIKATIDNAQFWEQLGVDRNDVFYPASRNAHWSLPDLKTVKVSIKLDQNGALIDGTNPVVRLYHDGGNRIELVPTAAGAYANLLAEAPGETGGWHDFSIPFAGGDGWEKNVIGYIDPSLSGEARAAARAELEEAILRDVNYLEISIRSTTSRSDAPADQVSYYIDGLELVRRP